MCVYICEHTHVCMCVYIYIYEFNITKLMCQDSNPGLLLRLDLYCF